MHNRVAGYGRCGNQRHRNGGVRDSREVSFVTHGSGVIVNVTDATLTGEFSAMPSRSGFVRVATSSFNLSALILNGSPPVSILTRTAPPSSETSSSFSDNFFQLPQVISAVSKGVGLPKAASSRT